MHKIIAAFLSALIVLMTSCEKKSSDIPVTSNPADIEKELSEAIDSFTENMFVSGAQAIKNTRTHANELNQSITTFLETPTEQTLATAQQKWLDVALAYRAFYFYRHISDVDAETFSDVDKLDNHIASFPIQPGVLDKVGEYPYSGLVHDIGIPIDEINLTKHHGMTDVTDVVLGLHAIEFLLFYSGEARDVNDFTRIDQLSEAYKERGFKNIREIPNNRRRQLLALQTKILTSDLDSLVQNWMDNGKGSARALWNKTYFGRMTGIANQSIVTGLSAILLEINELNQKNLNEASNVPETIKSRDFALKQKFIGNALRSIKSNTLFLSHDKKTQLDAHLAEAIDMTTITYQTENSGEDDYWKTLFSHVKNAGDIAMR